MRTFLIRCGDVRNAPPRHFRAGRCFCGERRTCDVPRGGALNEGVRYGLAVRGTAKDAQGCPFGADRTISPVVGPADHYSLGPGDWAPSPTAQNSTAPLLVHLEGPRDHLSRASSLSSIDAGGVRISRRDALADGQQDWRLVLLGRWSAQTYHLAVGTTLEEPACNRHGVLHDQSVCELAIGPKPTLPFHAEDALQ